MAGNDKLWDTYIKTKDPQLREKLILEYVPLVKILAGKQAMRFFGHVEMEDMISYGTFGLIDAIDKFDSTKGVKFETYASIRIKGAIIDSIRQLDWAPRSLRNDNKRLEQVFRELENTLGREPNDGEMAERMGMSRDDLRAMIRKSAISTFISLDDYMEQDRDDLGVLSDPNSEGAPEAELLKKERSEILTEAIEKLTEKERLVITLYYYEELTLKEISNIMSVTESRVSQIHSKAVFKLKTKMGKHISSLNL
ncbi:MAG: FliA/WhiG family RNA polymerase sigma factor [Clostridiales bacterium]|jgi:RNA polymerase sigma factor for flagellar operon FliA|nr:FliA/WhiG family RNA polymerase sigma factor [Clostridiales bacterium]